MIDWKKHFGKFQSGGTKLLIALAVGLSLGALIHPALRGRLQDLFMLKLLPDLKPKSSWLLILLMGFLTSFHCLGMCGGLIISQRIACPDGNRPVTVWLTPVLWYNAGRMVSYTLMGGLAGGLGHLLRWPGIWQGLLPVTGGVIMVVLGLHLTGIAPGLRRFCLPIPPVITQFLSGNPGSWLVGMLSGLMPCGPLQTMQIYALGTGNIWDGAAVMLLFALGTLPMLQFLGSVGSLLNHRVLQRFMKLSAALVIMLGMMLAGHGLALLGLTAPTPATGNRPVRGVAMLHDGYQTVSTVLQPYKYEPITVQTGIPVRWTIKVKAKDLNGCNNALIIPKYRIEKKLKPGDNLVEFTPGAAGVAAYSCWMGMIKSKITIVTKLPGTPE